MISNHFPPLSVDLPSVFNINSNVQITWPVVDLNSVRNLLQSGINSDLDFTLDSSRMKKSDFDRKALKLTIYADTVVIRNDITLTNLKSLKVVARKMLIDTKGTPTITLRTIAKAGSSWHGDTAAGM